MNSHSIAFIQIRVPKNIHAGLKELAKQDRLSVNRLALKAIRQLVVRRTINRKEIDHGNPINT